MSKKYNVQTTCPYCGNPIIISYTKFKPFKNSGITDVRLEISVGCQHFLAGPIDGYAEMGRDLLHMKEDRRITYQDLEDKEHREKMRKILGDYDEDSKYDPSRF